MAMNLAPSHWLPSYSADSSGITIPLSALPGLSAAEAHASTGDIRKVLRALCAAIYDNWISEAAADRPARMSIARNTSVDESSDSTTRTYQMRFNVAVAEEEVVDEPSSEG